MRGTRTSDWIRRHVLGLAAIFLALTIAPAWGATIGSSDIEPNAVLSKHIKDGQVRSPDIGNGQVTRADVALGAITSPKLAAGAVTAPKLATGAVGPAKLATSAVSTAKLATGAVTSAKVADNSLTGADIDESTLSGIPPSGSAGGDLTGTYPNPEIGAAKVGSAELADGAVGGAKLADAAVTIAKLGFDPATQAELNAHEGSADHDGRYFTESELSTSDGNAPNAGANRVHWNVLNGVPAGFADGTDDTGSDWRLGGNSGTNPATNFLGTTDNTALNLRVNNARGLRVEPASDGTNQSPNVIGGIADNSVTSGVHSATISGGGRGTPSNAATANRVTDNYGTIGGGANNQAGDNAGAVNDRTSATVGGGLGNTARGIASTVGGGDGNTSSNGFAAVGGGAGNTASGSAATVSGGNLNAASASSATVPGGLLNTAGGQYSLAAGRRAKANHDGAFVWGDSNNFDFASTAVNQFNVRSTGGARLVSGIDGSGNPTSGLELPAGTSGWSALVNGQPLDLRVNGARGLRIAPASDGTNQSPNVIGGIADNSVTAGVHSGTIAGGGRSVAGSAATANRVTDNRGTIGGGANNQAGDGAGTTSDREFATVAGGASNAASGTRAAVGGGEGNTASGTAAAVPGGIANNATQDQAAIGGGTGNTASGAQATVAGGLGNTASGNHAAVGGGASNNASGTDAAVGGGIGNIASGNGSAVLGGTGNQALGLDSLAAGNTALATDAHSLVLGDGSAATASAGANSFVARASGGFTFYTGTDNTTGATLASGSGSWASLSDRNSKASVRRVSNRGVLRKLQTLPIRTWRYKAERGGVRHIGPMAQDFFRAFGLGEDNRHITSVDADGVALAAIKGLDRELRAERRQRQRQDHRIDRLEDRLAALERTAR